MKIAYIFTSGRKDRMNSLNNSEMPSEFFFGVFQLKNAGFDVEVFELSDFNSSDERRLLPHWLLIRIKNYISRNTGLVSSCDFLNTDKLLNLNKYDIIIANNEYVALGLLPFILTGRLKIKMIFFVMGMLAKLEFVKNRRHFILGKKIYQLLISNSIKSLFVGKGEYSFAQALYPKNINKIEFIAFPIDTDFWCPQKLEKENFILFIGNDARRDYDLLLDVAKQMTNLKFVFITRNIGKERISTNVELIKGDWKERILTDEKIREYYCRAKLVILPIRDTWQPSGQSVAQQAMACATPVIISRFKGFWDYENFIHNKNIFFVDGKSTIIWKKFIYDCLDKSQSSLDVIGYNSRETMVEKYNINNFAEKLKTVLGV